MIIDQIKELLNHEGVLPSITFEITNVCNLKCVHCYLSDRSQNIIPEFLKLSYFENIISDLKELNVLSITLTGGEPLMHPQFFEIIKLLKDNNFIVNLMSNITLINEENIKYIAKNIDTISTTLYGFSNNTYNAVTCSKDGYQKYCKARDLIHSNAIKLEERGILLVENKCDIMKYVEKDMQVEMHISSSIGSPYAARHRVDEQINVNFYYEHLIKNNNDSVIVNTPSYICNSCLDSLFIKANGNINACANLDIGLGNIKNTSIKDIVQSGVLKKKRELFRSFNFSKCINCDKLRFNPLICPGNNQDETGCMFTPSEYSCNMCRSVSIAYNMYVNNKCKK